MTKQQQQLWLRVRHNSDLGRVMSAMIEQPDKTFTEDELRTIAGMARGSWNWRMAAHWSDNWFADSDDSGVRGRYIDVSPRQSTPALPTPAPVSTSTMIPQQEQAHIERISWPDAPGILEGKSFWRKPEWYDRMRKMVALGRHVSLEGPPSVGKDTAVEQLAAEEGRPLVCVSGDGGLRSRMLVGGMEMTNGSTTFVVAEFAAAVVNGWWTLITEINAADPDVLLILNALMAAPYSITINGQAYPVHKDFRLFVSYNNGLVGTKPLPQSTKDRFFSVKIPFFTDGQLRNRLEAHGLPKEGEEGNVWGTAVVEFGSAMWEAHTSGQIRYQISVRRLVDAITMMNESVTDKLKDALSSAVLDAIDSEPERKVARRVMNDVLTAHNM